MKALLEEYLNESQRILKKFLEEYLEKIFEIKQCWISQEESLKTFWVEFWKNPFIKFLKHFLEKLFLEVHECISTNCLKSYWRNNWVNPCKYFWKKLQKVSICRYPCEIFMESSICLETYQKDPMENSFEPSLEIFLDENLK